MGSAAFALVGDVDIDVTTTATDSSRVPATRASLAPTPRTTIIDSRTARLLCSSFETKRHPFNDKYI